METRVIKHYNGLTIQNKEEHHLNLIKPIIYLFDKNKCDIFFNPTERALRGHKAELIVVNGVESDEVYKTLQLITLKGSGEIIRIMK